VRKRSVVISAVLVAVLVSVTIGWRLAGASTFGTVTVRTPDGHFQFRMPASWRIGPCSGFGDCYAVGPLDAPDRVELSIDLAVQPPVDPYPQPGATLIIRMTADPSITTVTVTVDGRPATRTFDPEPMLTVPLDPGGDIATVQCPARGALTAGCTMVMSTLHIHW
jgi:hypothetical protein